MRNLGFGLKHNLQHLPARAVRLRTKASPVARSAASIVRRMLGSIVFFSVIAVVGVFLWRHR